MLAELFTNQVNGINHRDTKKNGGKVNGTAVAVTLLSVLCVFVPLWFKPSYPRIWDYLSTAASTSAVSLTSDFAPK